MLNTGRVSVATCVDHIVDLSRRPEFQATDESVAMLRNVALQAHIQTALRSSDPEAHIAITPEVDGGHVTLRGVVLNDHERQLATQLARSVPGVQHVENALRVMKTTHRYVESGDAQS